MLKRLAILVCLVGVSLFGVVSPASAASGTGLDGTDPTRGPDYCANGSYAIYNRAVSAWNGQYIGTVEVRYSPNCGTNWIRAYGVAGNEHVDKRITRRAQGGLPYYTQFERDYPGSGWTYGMQAYAPGATPLRSVFTLSVPAGLSPTRHA